MECISARMVLIKPPTEWKTWVPLRDVRSCWGHWSPEWPLQKPGESLCIMVDFFRANSSGCCWASSDSIPGSWKCLEVLISLGDHSQWLTAAGGGKSPYVQEVVPSSWPILLQPLCGFQHHACRTLKHITPAAHSNLPFRYGNFPALDVEWVHHWILASSLSHERVRESARVTLIVPFQRWGNWASHLAFLYFKDTWGVSFEVRTFPSYLHSHHPRA